MAHEQTAIRTIYYNICGNIALVALKGLGGVFGNSHALIADAIESTSDVFTSLLVLFGLTYARRPADKNHPYGHGRAEALITFLVAAFLIISAAIIGYESIMHIGSVHEPPKVWTLAILVPIILSKEIAFRLVMRKAKQTNSSTLKAEARHHRSDAITSVAACIGISIALLFGEGFEDADDWAALFAAGFILYNSYLIFRPALGEIMDEHLYGDLECEIREVARSVEGIIATEKCFIRKSGMQYYVDLHATVDKNITVDAGHNLAHKLKDTLLQKIPQLGNVLVHIEPDGL